MSEKLVKVCSVGLRTVSERVKQAAELAMQVRKDLAAYAREHGCTRYRDLCGVATLMLRRRCEVAGIPAEVCLRTKEITGWNGSKGRASHAWIEVDGHIVDPTATQFWDCPPVLVRPDDDPLYLEMGPLKWTGELSVNELRSWSLSGRLLNHLDEIVQGPSPAMKLIGAFRSVAFREPGTSRASHLINSSAETLMRLCISSGVKFDIDDLDRLGGWCGYRNEYLYAQAVQAGHTSFCKAWERAAGRPPFLLRKGRLYVGCDFKWPVPDDETGQDCSWLTVTSIDRDTLIACRRAYDREKQVWKIRRRYTITRDELGACTLEQSWEPRRKPAGAGA